MNLISLSDPVLGEEEKRALASVIDSGWLTMGDRVAAFEKSFARLQEADGAAAVSSCTAGLHLCLEALGIGPGDEVLVPSLTFVATANAVLYVGGTPVFVDIEKERPHISIKDAEAKLTPKTKAAIVMHYGGYLVDLPAWQAFAKTHALKLVEDAAHAPAMKGVGRLSDAAAFSFFSNKNMTTGEGGMVVARDGALLEQVRRLRSHGMTTGTLDRYRGHAYSYDVTALGFNYRMDELRAAIGLVQIAHVDEWNKRRRKLTVFYRRTLEEHCPRVSIPFGKDHETAAHLLPVLLPEGADRNRVMTNLRKEKIQSSVHYPPIHTFSYFRRRFPKLSLPNTEHFCARELTLPLHPSLTERDVERVASSLAKFIDE
ncbi:MAG: DegT/DnrJ/EryC1/StrS family aminotransferase [Thermodesulfobacteriota bacterium]